MYRKDYRSILQGNKLQPESKIKQKYRLNTLIIKISRKWGRRILAAIILAFILNTAAWALHRAALQKGIAEAVLRFHVLANSDSDEDQSVKYEVRDALLNWMNEAMEGQRTELSGKDEDGNGRAETLAWLENHLAEIESKANETLAARKMSYRATAEICSSYFPERTYGDCTFPAGWYQALRIKLGTGQGHNWWCVLYPRLCFSDCLHAVFENDSGESLEEVLTEEEYESLFSQPQKWKFVFSWF